ncbi:MAG: glycerol kinase GlpK [Erysipelotrichaceae bacterium]|nr:glycerol kinase GlpK [Erysipelotrichaceae bacterium]
MMEKYVLAIDQGTTSTRAIIFDSKQQVVKVAQKEITNFFPKPGWVEQDANEIWLSTLAVMAQIFDGGQIKPEQVVSIGISNQRETTVVWDSQTGLPVYHAIVWQSRQTSDIVGKLKEEGYEPMIKEKTGLVLDPYFSASKIKWIRDNVEGVKDNPNLLFGTIDTFLLWKFTCGQVHATDVTNASRTLLFNIHTLSWDKELLDLFEVPASMLPEIRDTSGFFGYIDPRHFFNRTCPITALVGDQQAALFGESCFEKSNVKNTYGTGGFILVNTGDEAIISKYGLLSTVAWKIGTEVKYALEGSIFVSGSLIQWLRDEMKFFIDAKDSEELARSVEDSGGVIIVPAFTGLGAPYWNDKCKGAIFGLTRGSNRGHLARASIEAMAFQSKDLINVMEEDLKEKIRFIKVDGGASVNKLLVQFQSDILEIPVIRPLLAETTALGAARLSGLAVDFYSMDDFKEESFERYEPKMDHEEVERRYERWVKAVKATQEF